MWDCAIVGAGPAGLTAATYLGRFMRNVVVIDDGQSRMKRIPLTRNTPGFPEGIAGEELYARMRDASSRYGAVIHEAKVDQIERASAGFRLRWLNQSIEASTLLLATGSRLIEPDLPNIDDALKRGVLRYCPICDGYEVEGKSIAVLGGRAGAIAEAHFLRTFSDRVSYFWKDAGVPTDEERRAAEAASIRVAAAPITRIKIQDKVDIDVSGATEQFDVLYPCLGCAPQSEFAKALGAEVSDEGGVRVDQHQQTRVAGLYAAGDVLQGLDQIASACGQAAIAAVAIHNALRDLDLAPSR
jgi:thioredoxin reductase (NADPH)